MIQFWIATDEFKALPTTVFNKLVNDCIVGQGE